MDSPPAERSCLPVDLKVFWRVDYQGVFMLGGRAVWLEFGSKRVVLLFFVLLVMDLERSWVCLEAGR